MARAQLASAAAWSPNPGNPPFYLDLPTRDGEPQPDVLAKWAANAPLAFIDQYVGNLRRYRGIALDVGDQDGLRTDTGKAARRAREVRNRQPASSNIRARIPAAWPTAFRTTCCRSSASICASTPAASSQMTATCAGGTSA